MPMIDMEATGRNIRTMIKDKGFQVKDIQKILGFNTPQAMYKWFRGDAMPTLDNMVILAKFLDTTIDDMLVIR